MSSEQYCVYQCVLSKCTDEQVCVGAHNVQYTHAQVGMCKCVSLILSLFSLAPSSSPSSCSSSVVRFVCLSPTSAEYVLIFFVCFPSSIQYVQIFLLEQFLRELEQAMIIFRSYKQAARARTHTRSPDQRCVGF